MTKAGDEHDGAVGDDSDGGEHDGDLQEGSAVVEVGVALHGDVALGLQRLALREQPIKTFGSLGQGIVLVLVRLDFGADGILARIRQSSFSGEAQLQIIGLQPQTWRRMFLA